MADLAARIVEFGRLLRAAGLPVTPGRILDANRAAALIDLADVDLFRTALRANFTASVEEFPLFAAAFDAFWLGRRTAAVTTPEMTTIQNRSQAPPVYALVPAALAGFDPDGEARLPGGDHTAGDADILTLKDFREYGEADLPRLRRLIAQLAPTLATARSRRWEAAPGGAVHLRRTLQRARRRGGEVAELAFARPKRRKLRVVALLDVSGSMDVYARHLLGFFAALQVESGGVRTFVFSTRIRDVTRELRARRYAEVLAGLSLTVEAWSGGTTIGACLAEFNARWGKALTGPRTVVVIASDGWERGETPLLAGAMKTLQRRAARVIWLNPLKAREGYQPLAGGMAAALPYVDDFLPCASLADLERLKRELAHGR